MSRQVKKVNISSKEDKSNKVSSWSNPTTDTHYPSEKLVKDSLDGKANSTHTHSQYLTEHQDLSNYVTTDDSRLSDARTPTSHTHTKSQITDFPTLPTASSTVPSADTQSGSYGSGTSYARSNHTHPKSSLYAEASHTHSQYLTSHQDITGKEDSSNKVSSWNSTTNNIRYPTEKLVKDSLDGKQATLVSGTNIRTINNTSILGSGDIFIPTPPTIVTAWETTPSDSKVVSEKLVKDSLDGKSDNGHTHSQYLTSHQDISGKEDKSNKVTSISSSSTDTQYPSAKLLYNNTIKSLSLTNDGKLYLITQEVATVSISPTTSQIWDNSNSYVDITTTVRDSNNNPIEGIMVEIQSLMVNTNTYVTIKTGYTNSNGISTIRVGYDDLEYGINRIYAYCGGIRSTQYIQINKLIEDFETPL